MGDPSFFFSIFESVINSFKLDTSFFLYSMIYTQYRTKCTITLRNFMLLFCLLLSQEIGQEARH